MSAIEPYQAAIDAYSQYWYGQNDYKAIIFIYMLLKITKHSYPRLRSIDTSINNVNKNIYTYTYDPYIYIQINNNRKYKTTIEIKQWDHEKLLRFYQ